MRFFISGYYLIQGSLKGKTWIDEHKLLPTKIWSGSRHICSKFPDAWIFKWVNNPGDEEEREENKKVMNLPANKFSEAQKEFDVLLSQNQYGFPNVFMSSELAIENYHRYFHFVSDLKLLGLGLPELYWNDFMAQYTAIGFEPTTRNGVFKKLQEREYFIEQMDGQIIGYDILGFDGADFCSLLCSGSEYDAHYQYGINFNQFGLISEYEKAKKFSDAISGGEIILEDGFWAPWLVFEIELKPQS